MEYKEKLSIKDVRIGNIVLGSYIDEDENGEEVFKYVKCRVMAVDENGELGGMWNFMLENLEEPNETDYYEGMHGVDLTEEILKDNGFIHYHKNCFILGNLTLKYDNISKNYRMFFGGTLLSIVKYVHELQDFCFKLFNKEIIV